MHGPDDSFLLTVRTSSKSFNAAGTYSTRAMRADSSTVTRAGVVGRGVEPPAASSAAAASSASESLDSAVASSVLETLRTVRSARSCVSTVSAPTHIVAFFFTCSS